MKLVLKRTRKLDCKTASCKVSLSLACQFRRCIFKQFLRYLWTLVEERSQQVNPQHFLYNTVQQMYFKKLQSIILLFILLYLHPFLCLSFASSFCVVWCCLSCLTGLWCSLRALFSCVWMVSLVTHRMQHLLKYKEYFIDQLFLSITTLQSRRGLTVLRYKDKVATMYVNHDFLTSIILQSELISF